MNRETLLFETDDLTVRRFDHPPHEIHEDPDDECAERWSIAFVRAGRFDVFEGDRRHRLATGGVLLSRPGLRLRYAHDESCPSDVCTAVALATSAATPVEQRANARPWVAQRAASPRLAFVSRRLHEAIADGRAFEMERWALASVSALCGDFAHSGTRGAYASRPKDLDAVVAATRAMERQPDVQMTIADRARAVGLTSTMLAAAFLRHVGTSPHRYVIGARLVHSTKLLSEGMSVTESCYASGFDNLSHFCRTFVKVFGVRASAWVTQSVHERQKKVQALYFGGR